VCGLGAGFEQEKGNSKERVHKNFTEGMLSDIAELLLLLSDLVAIVGRTRAFRRSLVESSHQAELLSHSAC
jgi:hypothetical protein